jgi:hypothetical protein
MGLIVPTAIYSTAVHAERDDQPMPYDWFVGIDWGSQQHQVCVLDRDRRQVGERAVDHDGASLALYQPTVLTYPDTTSETPSKPPLVLDRCRMRG